MAKSRICSIDDCAKSAVRRTKLDCSVEGCKTKKWKGGFCKLHFRRKEKFGDPLAEPEPTPVQAFIQKAATCTDKDCLIWPFETQDPRAHVRINGVIVFASRHVCTLAHGDPPTPEHETAHSCGKGHLGCLNADHLRWATKIENQADRLIHGTDCRGEKSAWAILNRNDVRAIRKSLENGESQYSVARRYSVSRSCIKAIKERTSWAWLD